MLLGASRVVLLDVGDHGLLRGDDLLKVFRAELGEECLPLSVDRPSGRPVSTSRPAPIPGDVDRRTPDVDAPHRRIPIRLRGGDQPGGQETLPDARWPKRHGSCWQWLRSVEARCGLVLDNFARRVRRYFGRHFLLKKEGRIMDSMYPEKSCALTAVNIMCS